MAPCGSSFMRKIAPLCVLVLLFAASDPVSFVMNPAVLEGSASISGHAEPEGGVGDHFLIDAPADICICPHPVSVTPVTEPPRTGDTSRGETREFIVAGGYTVTGELRRTGEHCYLYVEEGYDYYPFNVVQDFDSKIYPEISTRMGTPNDIDGDDRIYIFYYNMGNNGIAGYFWPQDPNGLDIIYLNLLYDVGADVVAHEFTHLTQNNYDKMEERWIDEGLAEMAKMHIYGNPRQNSFMEHFEAYNTITLNWKEYSSDPQINYAQYGIAYVFQQYIYDQFDGLESSGLILRDGHSFEPSGNEMRQGIAGIEHFLDNSNSSLDFTPLFVDWTIANVLNNPYIGNGSWGYDTLDIAVDPTYHVDELPFTTEREVVGYAPNYITMDRTQMPTRVYIETAGDVSLAVIYRSSVGRDRDRVDILKDDSGTIEVEIPTQMTEWDCITLDVINHKDEPEPYLLELSEVIYEPPVAVAGDNVTVVEGAEVFFDASGSYHPQHRDIVRYEWDLDDDGEFDAEGARINHTYEIPGNYTVGLFIVDDVGLNSTDETVVTVERKNLPPVPDMWISSITPMVFDRVLFDASNSTDPENDELFYSWDMDGDGIKDASGSCVAWKFEVPGERTIRLDVTDARGKCGGLNRTIYIRENTPPVAVPPMDMEVNEGDTVTLEDTASHDTDGHAIFHTWSFEEGSMEGARVNLTFMEAGSFRVTLNVTDELGASDTAFFTVRVNGAPVIKLEIPLEIRASEKIVISAGGTMDPEGNRMEYLWEVDGIRLLKERGDHLEYVFHETGKVIISLTARDSKGASSTVECDLDILPERPLSRLDIEEPGEGTTIYDRIELRGGNGGNPELDSVYVEFDDGSVLSAVDISEKGDWSVWMCRASVKSLALGEHEIVVYGMKGERRTPETGLTVLVDEHRKKDPGPTSSDIGSSGTGSAAEEIDPDGFYLAPKYEKMVIIGLPCLAFLLLLLAIFFRTRRDRREKRELQRLLDEIRRG